jgi:DNA-binding transcriptional LysR family regulator
MLDPHQLRIFLIAVETLNFTRAAERLHMSQPSVTQHIQMLEAQLNAALFLRKGRKLQLTEPGQALVPLARQIVSLALRTEEIMGGLQNEVHGKLIIACSTTPGKYILPVLIARFMRKFPAVQGVCEVHPRDKALELLEQDQVHFAFSNVVENFHRNIEFRKFLSDPVCLIAPVNHPWAHRGLIDPDELQTARFILREPTAGTYRVTREALARLEININDLQTILTVGNSEAIAMAVKQGVGVGFVSRMVAENMAPDSVAQVLVRGLTIQQDVYLCRHRFSAFSNLQTAFWEFAGEEQP